MVKNVSKIIINEDSLDRLNNFLIRKHKSNLAIKEIYRQFSERELDELDLYINKGNEVVFDDLNKMITISSLEESKDTNSFYDDILYVHLDFYGDEEYYYEAKKYVSSKCLCNESNEEYGVEG